MRSQARQRRSIRRFSIELSISAFVAIFAFAVTALASSLSEVTTLHAVRALSNAEANRAQPVAFEATVSYSRGYENVLFVQDGEDAIFVRSPAGIQWKPGDRILVRGKMQGSFRPIVVAQSLTLLHHGALTSSIRRDDSWPARLHACHDSCCCPRF
jgi:hypothetical protein